jgi:hypothetical protein
LASRRSEDGHRPRVHLCKALLLAEGPLTPTSHSSPPPRPTAQQKGNAVAAYVTHLPPCVGAPRPSAASPPRCAQHSQTGRRPRRGHLQRRRAAWAHPSVPRLARGRWLTREGAWVERPRRGCEVGREALAGAGSSAEQHRHGPGILPTVVFHRPPVQTWGHPCGQQPDQEREDKGSLPRHSRSRMSRGRVVCGCCLALYDRCGPKKSARQALTPGTPAGKGAVPGRPVRRPVVRPWPSSHPTSIRQAGRLHGSLWLHPPPALRRFKLCTLAAAQTR